MRRATGKARESASARVDRLLTNAALDEIVDLAQLRKRNGTFPKPFGVGLRRVLVDHFRLEGTVRTSIIHAPVPGLRQLRRAIGAAHDALGVIALALPGAQIAQLTDFKTALEPVALFVDGWLAANAVTPGHSKGVTDVTVTGLRNLCVEHDAMAKDKVVARALAVVGIKISKRQLKAAIAMAIKTEQLTA